jgi:hypothetical protein
MKVVALAGGVGGAKLADGLPQILLPEDLTIILMGFLTQRKCIAQEVLKFGKLLLEKE